MQNTAYIDINAQFRLSLAVPKSPRRRLHLRRSGRDLIAHHKKWSTRLSPSEFRLLLCLVAKYPLYADLVAIYDAVYGDDDDGGPDDLKNVVRAFVNRVRVKMAGSGWRILNAYGGMYRLEVDTAE